MISSATTPVTKVLIGVARTMQAALREYDLCGRWGGEEFLILLPQTAAGRQDRHSARSGGHRRIGDATRQTRRQHHRQYRQTSYQPGESFSQTVNRADDALLEAKRAGRNCCRVG